MSSRRPDAGNIIPYRRDEQVGLDDLSRFDVVPRIERHAADMPDHTAVTFGADVWTYRDLVAAADRLVHRLKEAGVSRQDRVALCAAPDAHVPIALLAILKMGAVYVPIGYDYPKARVQAVVDDVRPAIVLTAGGTGSLFEDVPVRVSEVADLCAPMDAEPLVAPPVKAEASDDAYIFYTSGTTGAPKGIAVGYGALRYYVYTAVTTYGMGRDDIMLSVAKYSFSISLFELLSPLVAGGTLCLLERDRVMTASELIKALQQATFAHIGPSLMRRTLEHVDSAGIDPRSFDGLRHISSGGDTVPPGVVEGMKRVFAKADIFVFYGCTEIACMGCNYVVSRDQVIEKTYVGKPFDGAEILLLGEDERPVPAGERGEVLFAGPGLLNGYVNKPHLTQKKLIVIDGKTWFRTGDVGRLSPSGDLELLGRQDFQIKVHGLRIEPVEIEVHLRRVPGVREAVVSAVDGKNGNRQLVAYLVTDTEACPTIPEIRAHLDQHLPEYMIPSIYALLDSLPLNHNLKLDRNALPAPETCELLRIDEAVPPRNETEAKLVAIWQAELGHDTVGITNDFFDLGGDSLMAVTLCLVVSDAFGVAMRPSDLFETARTIEALAILIEQRRAAAARDETAGPDRATRDQPLPLLPPALRFLKERDNLDPHRWNIAQLLESKGPLDPDLVKETVTIIARRHDSLGFRLSEDGDHWFSLSEDEAGTGMFGHVDFAAVGDHDLPQAIADLAEREQAGLDLHHGPVARIIHVDLGPDRSHRLLVIAHHLAADGTSWPVLIRDLVWTYEHLSGHRPNALVGRTGSYRAWGQALLDMGAGSDLLEQVDHWTDRPWEAVKPLPVTGAGPNSNQSVRTVDVHLSVTETEQLRMLLPRGASTTELLIPTLARAIAKWVGSEWVLIDSLEDGRTLPGVDTVFTQSIGFMGCYIPLLLQAGNAGEDNLRALGSAVRKAREEGYAHDVLRYLAGDPVVRTRMAALPRAEVIFNYGRNMRSFLPEDTLFEEADESPGNTHNPLNSRDYALGAVADRIRGQLALRLVFSRNLHDQATIQGVLDDWAAGLRNLL